MFFRRGPADPAGNDRLHLKLWLFVVGAALALAGMGLQNDWVMGAAGVVLLAGIVLRFAGRRGDEAGGRE